MSFEGQVIQYTKSVGPLGRVLDLGCGLCRIEPALVNEAMAMVVAVDKEDFSVYCPPEIVFLRMDILDFLDDDSEKYEVVLLLNVLHYLRPAKVPQIFRRLNRALADGARVFVSVPHTSGKIGRAYQSWDKPLDQRWQGFDADQEYQFGIHDPVCLWHEDELVTVIESSSNLRVVSRAVDDDGNLCLELGAAEEGA